MTERWITNVYDCRKPNAKRLHHYSSESYGDSKLRENEWQEYLDWINKHVIGLPKATETSTQQELIDQGIIGIYENEN